MRAPTPFLIALVLSAGAASALDASKPEVGSFIERMQSEHGFDPQALGELLAQAEHKPKIVEAISRPAERTKPWHEYRDIFLTEKRISAGVGFWQEHGETLGPVSDRFGATPDVVLGILGVETRYGAITGSYRVLDSLATLSFGYPPRADFFRSELEQFLLLAREEAVDPLSTKGSYAGAMGAPQFISSSYRHYSVDGSGDGKRDLFSNWADVVGSVANYLSEHGWRNGAPVVARARLRDPAAASLAKGPLALEHTVGSLREGGVEFETALPDDADAMLVALEGAAGMEYWVGFRNFYVITRYNRSRMYAMAVHQLGEAISQRIADESP